MTIHATRQAARNDASDTLNELRSTLESIITSATATPEQREAALQELNQVNSRWENLLDRSRRASTYDRVQDDFQDRLVELRTDVANASASGSAMSYFTLGEELGLNRMPTLMPRTADWTDGESMASLLERNPEGFKDWWKGLDSSEREVAMMKLQEHMQLASQLQTMLTNLMSAQHDSAMAIARNLAV